MANQKLKSFTITVGGGASSNAFYANGNQQCKVTIDILKQSYSNNSWVKTDLTQEEINSLTVMTYSDQLYPNPPLPAGWSCDRDKNVYTEGLRGSTYAAMEEPSDAELAVQASTTNEVPQTFYRYMRADRTGNQKFMACVTLYTDAGPVRYSTHFDNGDERYESSIIIDPQPAYTLRLSQLSASKNSVYHCGDKDNEINVDTYYWTLPSGVWILSESFSNAGWTNSKLQYAFVIPKDGYVRMGVAVRLGVTSLNLGEIDGGLPSQYWSVQVPLIPGNNMLRAVWYESWASNNGGNYNRDLSWSITDNYGCASRFVLRAKDTSGKELTLIDA